MYQPFNRSTFISCENAASEVPKLQSDLNFWYSAIISCGGPPKSPFQRTFVTHDLRKGLRLWQLPIRIPPHLCASDAHDFRRVLRDPKTQLHFTTRLCVLCVRQARSPQRVRLAQKTSHFAMRLASGPPDLPRRSRFVTRRLAAAAAWGFKKKRKKSK